MKFLIIQTPPKIPPSPEQAKTLAQVLEFSVQIFRDLKQRGKLESVYGFPSGGGVGILNVESTEELNEILLGIPVTAFGITENHALLDIEVVAKQYKKFANNIK